MTKNKSLPGKVYGDGIMANPVTCGDDEPTAESSYEWEIQIDGMEVDAVFARRADVTPAALEHWKNFYLQGYCHGLRDERANLHKEIERLLPPALIAAAEILQTKGERKDVHLEKLRREHRRALLVDQRQ